MNTQHLGTPRPRLWHYTITIIGAGAAILTLTVITVVSWNLFAPELFGLATIDGREALGMILLLAVAAALLRGPQRRHRRHSSELSADR